MFGNGSKRILLFTIFMNAAVFTSTGNDKCGNFDLPHFYLEDKMVSKQEFITMINENKTVDFDDNSKIAFSYRIVDLLHFVLCARRIVRDPSLGVVYKPIAADLDGVYIYRFYDAFYWLDNSVKKGKTITGENVTRLRTLMKELIALKECIDLLDSLYICIQGSYHSTITLSISPVFKDFEVMNFHYQKAKVCMRRVIVMESTIKYVNTCIKTFFMNTKSFEEKYNNKLLAKQRELGIEPTIDPTLTLTPLRN